MFSGTFDADAVNHFTTVVCGNNFRFLTFATFWRFNLNVVSFEETTTTFWNDTVYMCLTTWLVAFEETLTYSELVWWRLRKR